MKKLLMLAALAFSIPAFSACSPSESYYRDQYVQQQMESYVYHTDFNYVWTEARALLFQYGYQVRGDASTTIIETEWARTSTGLRRYMVAGYVMEDGSSTVHFDYYEETDNGPDVQPYTTTGRDYRLEYELVRRVESSKYA